MESGNEIKKQTKRELFAELDKLKSDVNSLRKDLNKANSDKELWYFKKEESSNGIRKKINDIKQSRENRKLFC